MNVSKSVMQRVLTVKTTKKRKRPVQKIPMEKEFCEGASKVAKKKNNNPLPERHFDTPKEYFRSDESYEQCKYCKGGNYGHHETEKRKGCV